MVKVLIVDDDRELCDLLRDYLEPEGFTVESVGDGASGAARALAGACDLVLLDVMLPGMSGMDALRAIRARSHVPLVMLTARGDSIDRVLGLELGADDYISKPFAPRELLARMRAVLRRIQAAPGAGPADVREIGDLRVDCGARRVTRGHEDVALTGAEFSLLVRLVARAGEVVGREELFRDVLGRRLTGLDRSLDVHVSNLRRKLGPLPGGRERIKTVRGSGYVYVRDEGTPATAPAGSSPGAT